MGFFDNFSGGSSRRDIRASQAKADTALQQGFTQSQGYYDQAANSLNPYAQSGQQANTFYNNALGLNGDAARSQAQGTITSDPLWQGKLAEDQNQMLRYLNARGESGGGKALLAGQRVLTQNYGDWLNRYRDQGQQGFQATGQQANIRTAQGDNAYGYGATKAGMATNYGNAMAGTRSTGLNNLLNIAATGINAASAAYGVPKPPTR